jgi:CO/xanthine dehydrogenase Mo-binding subunit
MTLPASLKANPRLSSWFAFPEEGVVLLSPGKVEIGQGILTALAQIAAEELEVSPGRVRVKPVVTGESPDEQVTAGSLSVQDSGAAIRHAAAEIRTICLSVAAQRSGVPKEAIRIEDGVFLGPAGPLGSYWTIAEAALSGAEATPGERARPASSRRVVGASLPRLDLPDKVFGRPRFLHDIRLPGMLHARMVRPPAARARLLSIAEGTLPEGARLVRNGSFLAAVAESEAAAERAAERIARRARWEAEDSLPDAAALSDWLAAAPAETTITAERGEAAAPPEGTPRVSAVFEKPFVAHASIGVCCALARCEGDALEVISHAQGPYNLRADLALAFGLPPERVTVRHAEGAGCYGHNGADDVAFEAAVIARAIPGRWVRLQWSRAEELAAGPFSPAMRIEIEAALDAAGEIAVWRTTISGNGHSSRPGRAKVPVFGAATLLDPPFPPAVAINMPLAVGGGAERNAVPGYRVGALKVVTRRLTVMPIRASALRGLGAIGNVWAIESVLDELAAQAGEDPLAFRLRRLDDPRAAAALARAAEMAGWERRARAEGVGFGCAVARYKGSGAWCAAVAEILAEAEVRCTRLWLAADIGEAVNPDGAANQLEGGAIQAVSIALKEQVRFDHRRIESDSWDTYPILRFSEVPEVQVALMERPGEPPLGAGEASVGPVVGAIANAIADALGVRPRRMPFTAETIAAAL